MQLHLFFTALTSITKYRDYTMTPLRSLFAALLLPLCATAAHAQDWKEIRFGVFPEYPPFESVAADGSLQGFDIELGNAICAKLDVKCTWVHNEFDGMIPALRARKFDAIMSSMAVTLSLIHI